MRFRAFVLVALCVSTIAAHAASITYTETATASGSLNGNAFTNQLLTLTGMSDSTSVTNVNNSGFFLIPRITITGSVKGLGTFAITGVDIFDAQQVDLAGFEVGSSDILDTINRAFGTYDLKSAIGPVIGGSDSSRGDYATTTGDLKISSTGIASFQAAINAPPSSVTPEPSSFALLGTGLLGVAGVIRKRFA